MCDCLIHHKQNKKRKTKALKYIWDVIKQKPWSTESNTIALLS